MHNLLLILFMSLLLWAPIVEMHGAALPASDWWLVIHNQCDDSLHWINQMGEYTSIPRPRLPNEAVVGEACSYKPLHISQNGRYLVQTAILSNGHIGVGFYDFRSAQWLNVYEAQPNEFAYLGDRYSSDSTHHIAIGFANQQAAPRAWRVILFDMTTGSMVDELRSDGSEIANFVGAEFLADALTKPQVVLLAEQDGTYQIHIRFDHLEAGNAPFGSAIWYPQGAPGVAQELISGPYAQPNADVLPNGHAIFAYTDPNYPPGPPTEDTMTPVTSNAIGLLLPENLGDFPAVQLFFADGISTLYNAQWAADGEIALFWRFADSATAVHWIRMGSAVLIPLEHDAAQVMGVPGGFVYNAGESLYYLDMNTGSSTGPILTDPMLTGSTAFVWGTAFGNPPLDIDDLTVAISTPVGPTIVTATPDTSGCRVVSADGANVNVRSGPGTDYSILGEVGGSEELAVTGYNGEWFVVNYSGMQGWMAGWVVTQHGNCGALTWVAAPPPPPTEEAPAADIQFWADNTNLLPGTCTDIHWQVEHISEVYFEGAGVTGTGVQHVCPGSTTTYTLQVTLTDGTTQTRTVTITIDSGGGGQPDLYVSEMSVDPATPVQGQPVNVRVGVYNQGTAAVSSPFHITWYPGENYPAPACAWDIDSLAANGGRILTCTYAGYPSAYTSINMLATVDTNNMVSETDESNNSRTQAITVNSGGSSGQPDLYISELSIDPATPVKGQPANVRVGVYNQGTAPVSAWFHIVWYPGENYSAPACAWDLDSLAANGGRILTCTYAGYPSAYASINMLATVDTNNTITESDESNNSRRQAINVSEP
jgi:hypothetical protein